MSALPVLPLWVTKYEGNTAHLTLEEDGAYTRLLRLSWRTPGCSVPADASWVMRHMRVDEATFARAVKPILDEFFEVVDGRWQNMRLLAEYRSATEKTERRKAAGQKGGKAKALKSPNKQSSNAKILLGHSSSKPEPKPRGEPIGSSSEAKASEPTAGQTIFHVGKSLLAKHGVSDKAAGAVLGRLRKVKGEVEAARIIGALMANPKLDPEPYLWGIIHGRPAAVDDTGAPPQLELVLVDGKQILQPVSRVAA